MRLWRGRIRLRTWRNDLCLVDFWFDDCSLRDFSCLGFACMLDDHEKDDLGGSAASSSAQKR